jgi:hypothetical protein
MASRGERGAAPPRVFADRASGKFWVVGKRAPRVGRTLSVNVTICHAAQALVFDDFGGIDSPEQ